MLITITDDEVKARKERLSFLHGSPFVVDNLTAVMMDTSIGNVGFHEATARAKVHEVINWLKTITGVNIPERNVL